MPKLEKLLRLCEVHKIQYDLMKNRCPGCLNDIAQSEENERQKKIDAEIARTKKGKIGGTTI